MTHREEWDEQANCAECGALISRAAERGFAFGEAEVLCFTCAERRGGRYDADQDRWTLPPSLAGLPVSDEPAR
jgi:hypothetical protein